MIMTPIEKIYNEILDVVHDVIGIETADILKSKREECVDARHILVYVLTLAELNPVYKEKQETEKRFTAIEETVSGMRGSVDELKKMMTEFIKKMS